MFNFMINRNCFSKIPGLLSDFLIGSQYGHLGTEVEVTVRQVDIGEERMAE